jgi:putative phage-type endonuclease
MQDDRDHWLALRREGLGGSDVAAVVGLNPYRTPLQVYLDKIGVRPTPRETPAMALGTWVEPVLEALYQLVFARGVTLERPGLLIHRGEGWRRGTPDGLDRAGRRGVDYKYTHRRHAHRWGLPGTDAVPPEYLAQCAWYMDLTEARAWDVAVVVGGEEELAGWALRALIEGVTPEGLAALRRRLDFRVYCVPRDQELIALLVDQGRRFWVDHVVPRHPPPPEGSTDALDFLAARYPHVLAPMREATPAEAQALVAYREAWEEARAWQAEKARLEAGLKAAIGPALGLTAESLEAVWSAVAGALVVDWKRVALAAGATPELIAAHTTRLPEGRRFQVRRRADRPQPRRRAHGGPPHGNPATGSL